MKYVLVIFSAFSILSSNAQDYGWSDGLCDFSGYINPKLASQQQLDAIYGMIWNPNTLSKPAFRNRAKDSLYIHRDLVIKECEVFKNELIGADFPKNPIWDSLRKVRIAEIDRECVLKQFAISAIKNPDTLYLDKATAKNAKKWIKLLCSDDKTILKAYASWLGKEPFNAMKKNGWTDHQIVEQAKIDFLRFEWWNIARLTIPTISNHTVIETEFKKLLTNVQRDCH